MIHGDLELVVVAEDSAGVTCWATLDQETCRVLWTTYPAEAATFEDWSGAALYMKNAPAIFTDRRVRIRWGDGRETAIEETMIDARAKPGSLVVLGETTLDLRRASSGGGDAFECRACKASQKPPRARASKTPDEGGPKPPPSK